MTNWTPQLDDSLPTTRLRLGHTDLSSDPPLVRLTRVGGATAIFEAEVVDDQGLSTPKFDGDLYHHPQMAALYGQLDPGSRYDVQPVTNRSEVPVAKTVSVEIQRGDEAAIESFLKSENALLHPNAREIFPAAETPAGQGTFEVDVHRCTPDAHTMRVSDSTEIKMLDMEAERQRRASSEGGSGHSKGGNAGRRSGAGSGGSTGGGTESSNGGSQLGEDPEAWDYLDERTPKRGFDQVVGVKGGRRLARKLSRVLVPEIRKELEREYGSIKTGSALLMYGPPGCGKTLTAEAIAYELKHRCLSCGSRDCDAHLDTIEDRLGEVRFLEVECQKISSQYVGQAPDRLDAVFDRAYELADGDGFVVLFFDELDTLLTDSTEADNSSDIEVTNTFLRRGQGNRLDDKDILLVGATNYPYQMDTAAIDRFRFEMCVEPPKDAEELAELWRVLVDGQRNASQLNYDRLGEASVGFAPRELEQLRARVVDRVIESEQFDRTDLPSLTTDVYLDYIEEENPTTIDRYLSNLSDDRHELRGWNELQEFYQEWTKFLHEDGGDEKDSNGPDKSDTDPPDEGPATDSASESPNVGN
jgi:transitional endoplasmic reticulum ATPase